MGNFIAENMKDPTKRGTQRKVSQIDKTALKFSGDGDA